MKALRNYLDKIKPNFEEGGKFHAFQSVFDGFETFLFVPSKTAKTGTHIHDAIDSKRIMSIVVICVILALLFGMYNVGYQHFTPHRCYWQLHRNVYLRIPGCIA